MQVHKQLESLVQARGDRSLNERGMDEGLASLSSCTSALAAEQASGLATVDRVNDAVEALKAEGAAGGANKGAVRYLAQLVPAMMRNSSAASAMLRDARELVGRHRTEREALCVALRREPDAENAPPSSSNRMPTGATAAHEAGKVPSPATSHEDIGVSEEQAPSPPPPPPTPPIGAGGESTDGPEAMLPRRENSLERIFRGVSSLSGSFSRSLGLRTTSPLPPSPPMARPTTRSAARKEAAKKTDVRTESSSPARSWLANAMGRPATPDASPSKQPPRDAWATPT